MSTTKKSQDLSQTADELEELAAYYDARDTAAEMDNGRWVEPSRDSDVAVLAVLDADGC